MLVACVQPARAGSTVFLEVINKCCPLLLGPRLQLALDASLPSGASEPPLIKVSEPASETSPSEEPKPPNLQHKRPRTAVGVEGLERSPLSDHGACCDQIRAGFAAILIRARIAVMIRAGTNCNMALL
eukprot:scaffold11906_cov21-Tisochrysis_lutea.AAC.4